MRVDEELAAFLRRGVAAVVATRDERLRPAIGRGWAPRLSDDESCLTLCVEAPPASAMRSNLTGNGMTAATFSLPTTYRTVQVKGAVVDVREPTQEERDAVEEHCDAFSVEAEAVGLAARGGRRLLDPRLLTVTLRVSELFDQTPGPKAGTRL